MLKASVIINGIEKDFIGYESAFTFTFAALLHNSKYMSLGALKVMLTELTDLFDEFLTIKYEQESGPSRSAIKRRMKKIVESTDFITASKTKDDFLLRCGDFMMALEGKGLLSGFGFGSKKFNDTVIGNPEKTSVTRTAW